MFTVIECLLQPSEDRHYHLHLVDDKVVFRQVIEIVPGSHLRLETQTLVSLASLYCLSRCFQVQDIMVCCRVSLKAVRDSLFYVDGNELTSLVCEAPVSFLFFGSL